MDGSTLVLLCIWYTTQITFNTVNDGSFYYYFIRLSHDEVSIDVFKHVKTLEVVPTKLFKTFNNLVGTYFGLRQDSVTCGPVERDK